MAAGISARSREDLARVVGMGRRFVTVADVVETLGLDRRDAVRRVARWAEQGWLARVRRDLYVPVPVDAVNSAGWGADPIMLASEVWDPCYFSGWTAANHWGLTEQSFRTTIVKTTARVRARDQRLLTSDFMVSHVDAELLQWGTVLEWREERRVRFADPARTVVDILDDPALAGGVRLTAEVLAAYLEERDFARLVDYGDRLGNRTVFKRLGYLGQMLGLSEGQLGDCEERLSSGIPLLDPTQPSAGIRSPRWRLRVNVRVDGVEPS